MGFSMTRAWSDAVALVRGRWALLAIIAVAIHVLGAAIAFAFLPQWLELMRPTVDPAVQLARMEATMPRIFGLSLLSNLVQLAAYATMAALLAPDGPPLGRAVADGLKATPTLLISIVSLVVGFYVGLLVVILLMATLIAGMGALQANPAPAAMGPALALFFVLYFGVIVGAIYFVARFVVLLPAVVIERQYNPFAALARTWHLTRRSGWKIAGFILLMWIPVTVIVLAAFLAVGFPTMILSGRMPTLGSLLPLWAIGFVVGVGFAMLMSAVVVAIHRQLSESPPAAR